MATTIGNFRRSREAGRDHWVHSFLHIATTLSQTRQRNGILRRCEKGHRDVQNVARAAEKNAPIL